MEQSQHVAAQSVDDGSGSAVPYGMLTRLLRRIDHLEFTLLKEQKNQIADVAERMQDTVDVVGHIQKTRRATEDMQEMGLDANTGASLSPPPGVAQPKPSAPPMMGHRGPGTIPVQKARPVALHIDSPEGREPRGRLPAPAPAAQRAQSVPSQWSWAGEGPSLTADMARDALTPFPSDMSLARLDLLERQGQFPQRGAPSALV